MGKASKSKKIRGLGESAETKGALLAFLSRDDVMDRIRALDVSNNCAVETLLTDIRAIDEKTGVSLLALIRFGTSSVNKSVRAVFQELRQHSKDSNVATHHERRRLVRALGLNRKPPSLHDLQTKDSAFKVEHRIYQKPMFKRNTALADCDQECPSFGIVNAETGFRVVGPTESVVFVSPDCNGVDTIRLVVRREVGTQCPEWVHLQKWLNDANLSAIDSRRNVRPTHGGAMVQTGYNAGPRHVKIFGLAKSFTKNLDQQTKIIQDEEIIGAASLVWSFAQSHLPVEITNEIELHLKEEQMPHIATQNVAASDEGFQLIIDGKIHHFPIHPRAPPECYTSRGYCRGDELSQPQPDNKPGSQPKRE